MTKDARAGTLTILVVDDQADVREALRLLLKSAGYATQMAASPEEAVGLVQANSPDLIVLDMNYASDTTSGREGIMLLDRLHALNPRVPVIAMTGWSTIELAVEAMQHGACDFVTKPWDIHHLLEMFNKHLQAAVTRNRIDLSRASELAVAQRIQQRLLPPQKFAAAGLQFDCTFLPVSEVGGDLYDFFEESGSVAFLLGDVCGKGLGAAMLVATLQATFRSQRELVQTPAVLLDRVNRLFFHATRPEHFATLFLGVYDSRTGVIRYVNCGHPPAVLLRTDGTTETLDPSSIVLGAFENSTFAERSVPFRTGDRLVVFSDGFSEAGLADTEDDDWTLEAIRDLSRNSNGSLSASLAAAAQSRGQQSDDITVVGIEAVTA
ncbi:MAG TPA: SpoIIE family protein phosphatase [Bryobacteraceae bacterium]|nr:SpoIIE family protein phosphatase [Bryobacteraceae bacterium]